ncbi:MAG: radical SAM/SPASM domain-containing protein [Alistipes sp. 56_11]|nr:MAG: radical SAM/SPASM domain-containing protein [Alistipes sp. 56_11]
MPAADFLRTIDTITPHVVPNRVLIVITGGEALMRRDIEEVGRALYDRGYPWGIVTNGMLLDERRLESLLRAGLHTATVSLDGFAETHNRIRRNERSYERALGALRLLARQPDILYDAVTCANADTLATLPRFRDFLIAEGVKRWRIFTIFPVGRGADDPSLQLDTEQFRRLMEFIRDTRREGRIAVNYGCEGFLGRYEGDVRDTFYHCSAGVSIAGIRVDGAISGCTSIRARYDQGNIYRDDFMDVWNNRFAPYRDREWMRHGACGNCRVFKYCRGNGMHLRDETGQLLVCHYKKLL